MKESAEILLLLSKVLKTDKIVHDPDRRVALFFYPKNSEWGEYWSNLLEETSYTYIPLRYKGSGTRVGLKLVSEGVVEASY